LLQFDELLWNGFPLSIVILGLSHQSAPLELLEKSTIPSEDLPKKLTDLMQQDHISEAVVISTCNRTEIYVVAEKFHAAYAEVRDFVADNAFVAPEDIADYLYVHHDEDAVKHLFSVASGLDSAVLGESEIQGQVKTAWETSRIEKSSGPVLNLLFRHALETGKRVRSETSISRHTASVSHSAVLMATHHLGSLEKKKVLVVGAGEMAEGMVIALAAAGPQEVQVANRTIEKANDLAKRIGGKTVALSELSVALSEVDLLLTSTGATSVILDHTSVEEVVKSRSGRPLLIVDIAVPRDVHPDTASIHGVTLLDMDDLSAFAAVGREERINEVENVQTIIDQEVERFGDLRSAREMAPLISNLRITVDTIRCREIDRFFQSQSQFTDSDRVAIEQLTRSLIAKLLHQPTIGLKNSAGSAKGDRLADSVRDLFDL
jgi:glutamyl-tRNA reductase